jgi:hypothetical protein
MGLGKTRSAAIAAKLAGSRIVLLCPASLKLKWKRELMLCGELAAVRLMPMPPASMVATNHQSEASARAITKSIAKAELEANNYEYGGA